MVKFMYLVSIRTQCDSHYRRFRYLLSLLYVTVQAIYTLLFVKSTQALWASFCFRLKSKKKNQQPTTTKKQQPKTKKQNKNKRKQQQQNNKKSTTNKTKQRSIARSTRLSVVALFTHFFQMANYFTTSLILVPTSDKGEQRNNGWGKDQTITKPDEKAVT